MHLFHLSAIVLGLKNMKITELCTEAGDNAAMVTKETHNKMNCNSAACKTTKMREWVCTILFHVVWSVPWTQIKGKSSCAALNLSCVAIKSEKADVTAG